MEIAFEQLEKAQNVKTQIQPNASFHAIDWNFGMKVVLIDRLDARGEMQSPFILYSINPYRQKCPNHTLFVSETVISMPKGTPIGISICNTRKCCTRASSCFSSFGNCSFALELPSTSTRYPEKMHGISTEDRRWSYLS